MTYANDIRIDNPKAGVLQAALDSLTGGGTIRLGPGTYAGDLTMTNNNCTLQGAGEATVLTGQILMAAPYLRLRDCQVRATGKTYGVKIFRSGGDTPRCVVHNVLIGASAAGAGDGPAKGLWMDGSILNQINHCTAQFCTESGLYLNTSDLAGLNTTNANTFYDCTFNGNGSGGTGWGVELITGADLIAGMGLNRFHGGNMEANPQGAVFVTGNTSIEFQGVDFENGLNLASGNIVDIAGSNPVILENCNFTVTGAGVGMRMFLMSNCQHALVRGNRMAGFTAQLVGVFDESCQHCHAYNNLFAAAGQHFSNRGLNRGRV